MAHDRDQKLVIDDLRRRTDPAEKLVIDDSRRRSDQKRAAVLTWDSAEVLLPGLVSPTLSPF